MTGWSPVARWAAAALTGLGVLLSAQRDPLLGQGTAPRFMPHPSTQEPARLVTLDMLKRWEQELSNWGRWGKDDQRGMLNLITPEKTKAALALVTEAKTGLDTGTFGENLHRMARVHPVTDHPAAASRLDALVARARSKHAVHRTQQRARNRATQVVVPRQLIPHAVRQTQDPLPDRHIGEHMIDEMGGALRHPAAAAAGTQRPALAGERDQPVQAAVTAAKPREPTGEPAAV